MSTSATNSLAELRCSLFCSGPAQKGEPEISTCRQEEGKKSSFLLQTDDDTSITIVKPAHIKLEYRSNPEESTVTSPFFLGGFQLVSNAKHVEVYLTDKDGKESYLMTSKGIMFEKGEMGEEWYKAVSVVPGGPRPIMELHIKLLSLKPKDATIAFLKSLKVTARIPDTSLPASPSPRIPPAVAAATSASAQSPPSKEAMLECSSPKVQATKPSPSRASNASSKSSTTGSPALTQSDLGAAMSSLSLMARNAEDRIENAMCERFAKMEGFLDARWEKMEKHVHSLSSVVLSQKTLLAHKVKVTNQQQETLNAQAEQMDNLSKHQKGMSETISNLADDISKMRQVLQLVVDRGETAAETSTKHEKRQKEQDDLMKGQMGRIDTLIEQQRELRVQINTLQLQVSELAVGLQPIIEKGESDEERTYGGDSRYNASVEDNIGGGDDLMHFPDSDDDERSIPTKSLQGQFVTTSKRGAGAAAVNPAKEVSNKMDNSIAGTAEMTDVEWLDHLEKIEVNLIDDSSTAAKSTPRSLSADAGQQLDLLNPPIAEKQQKDVDFFAPSAAVGESGAAEQAESREDGTKENEEKQSFRCLPVCFPVFFKPKEPILLAPPTEVES